MKQLNKADLSEVSKKWLTGIDIPLKIKVDEVEFGESEVLNGIRR